MQITSERYFFFVELLIKNFISIHCTYFKTDNETIKIKTIIK
jgi:hypothetical protein